MLVIILETDIGLRIFSGLSAMIFSSVLLFVVGHQVKTLQVYHRLKTNYGKKDLQLV